MNGPFKIKLSIIIPAHNEEVAIINTLSGLTEKVIISHEIIVVEDHSSDTTSVLVENFLKKYASVRLLRNAFPQGFGNAIISGLEAARGEAVIIVMADLCDDFETIDIMYEKYARENYDLVCGSRYMRGGKKISGPRIQGFFSFAVSLSLRLLIGIPTWDVANSFKLYKRSFLNGLNYKIMGMGTEYSMRLAIQAYFTGAKIAEVPTTWRGESVDFWQEFKIFNRARKYARAYFAALFGKIKKFKLKIIFFGFFFILHLLSVFYLAFNKIDPSPIQDPIEYKIIGTNLLKGNGFSISSGAPYEKDMLRGPTYPLFLAITYFFNKTGLLAVALQQIFLVICGVWMLRIFASRGLTTIGYAFTAMYLLEPLQWMLSLQTMSETFYSFFIFAAFYFLISKSPAKHAPLFLREIFAGLLAGIAILTRPVGILWIPGLALLTFADVKGMLTLGFKRLLIFLLSLIVVISPWLVRNYFAVSRPILSSSYEYNITAGFGNRQEKDFILQGTSLYDSKGRQGAVLFGFTARAYPQVKKIADDVVERLGLFTLWKKQLSCSSKVWFRSRYDVILDMFYKGLGDSVLARAAERLDNIFWFLILILSIFGFIALYYYDNLFYVGAIIVILSANTLVNLCIAYTRMRSPLLPLIFLLSGLGAHYLFLKIRLFYRQQN